MFRAEERAPMANPITQLNRMATANSVERLVAERPEKKSHCNAFLSFRAGAGTHRRPHHGGV